MGKWSATDTAAEKIAASPYRKTLFIQNYDETDYVNLGIGNDAEDDEGVRLYPGDSVTLTGNTATAAISIICATGKTASGGWEGN